MQGLHVAALDAPLALEDVPLAHCVHVDLPADVWYVPDSQGVHDVFPDVFWNHPAVQSVHCALPLKAEYLAAGHCRQVVGLELPSPEENVPARHASHMDSEVAAEAVRYFPVVHGVQELLLLLVE